ncbi:hypothetical protein [Taibaiella koreensis]|uniref:hypothetical protein n=1 Tax=Taibaiella koreensis TaxID=1268548 RepID=UPI000E59ABC1|nr:hypothetical protein [Taibaiella koreensis]
MIALPQLYDTVLTAAEIPSDDKEHLLLVQVLKQRGFTVTDWGRGNMATGPRVVTLVLKKEIVPALFIKSIALRKYPTTWNGRRKSCAQDPHTINPSISGQTHITC